jgi:lipopolysaccharide/colanic/teichoic acid biosynthesis glycosyltransferase
MGLIIPEIAAADLANTCEAVEAEVRSGLANRFKAEGAPDICITLRVYPEPQRFENGETLTIDPYLYPDLHIPRNKVITFHALKRAMDVSGSGVLLLLLLPLLLVIAALVKTTSQGPVLFRQVRVGQMMKPFMICKFRTMYTNTDHGIHQNYVSWFINASGTEQDPEKKKVFKLTNDPRITPIGNFLRKTSLDELPQLWNVLLGDMSLVGPRPPLWYEVEQYKPWHRHRVLEAKPGVTGLWQVFGRSRTTFDDMVRLDLQYARTQSLWTDVKILLATPGAVISRKGAC